MDSPRDLIEYGISQLEEQLKASKGEIEGLKRHLRVAIVIVSDLVEWVQTVPEELEASDSIDSGKNWLSKSSVICR